MSCRRPRACSRLCFCFAALGAVAFGIAFYGRDPDLSHVKVGFLSGSERGNYHAVVHQMVGEARRHRGRHWSFDGPPKATIRSAGSRRTGRPGASARPFQDRGRSALFARRRAFDPLQAVAIRSQSNLVCEARHDDVEGGGEPPGKLRAVDHQPHLGVEPGRAWVEVERADEDPGPSTA